ncbi:MAG: hypothetical protein ACXWLC_05085 [Rhizomicrobium sp.]
MRQSSASLAVSGRNFFLHSARPDGAPRVPASPVCFFFFSTIMFLVRPLALQRARLLCQIHSSAALLSGIVKSLAAFPVHADVLGATLPAPADAANVASTAGE